MLFFDAFRQRAKWIEVEADALIEEHGKDAHAVADYMERHSNNLSAKFFWRAIKRVVLTRPLEDGIDLLPPVRATYCIACLVEKFSGMHESGGPPNFRACASCLTARRVRSSV